MSSVVSAKDFCWGGEILPSQWNILLYGGERWLLPEMRQMLLTMSKCVGNNTCWEKQNFGYATLLLWLVMQHAKLREAKRISTVNNPPSHLLKWQIQPASHDTSWLSHGHHACAQEVKENEP